MHFLRRVSRYVPWDLSILETSGLGLGSGVRILQGRDFLYVWYDYVILYLFGIYNYYNPLTLLCVVYYMY